VVGDAAQPLWEILLGGFLIVVSVLLHGIGMYLVQRRFARAWPHPHESTLRRQWVLGSLLAMMLATHLVEIAMWAAALDAIGAVPGFREAFYYASVTYTALGYEEGLLARQWRLLAPNMTISGLFAFGWTTGVLVSLVQKADEAFAREMGPDRRQA
jgi:hypothetical protein